MFAARELGDALAGLPELHVEPLGDRDARALLESVLAGSAGRARARADRRRDAREPARAAGAAARADAGAARGRIRPARGAAAVGQHRGELHAAAGRASRATRGACCSWRRPIRWAIRRSCGGRPSGSESPSRPRTSSKRRACWRSTPRWRSVIRSFARPSTERPGRRSDARSTARWRRRPIQSSIPDRRAWHRAQAAVTPDEDVAAELERSAGRAQARGGLAAAAAFLERAAALTPEPAHRAQRLLAAAAAKRDAGDLEAALGLLDGVETGVLDELGRARVDLLRAQIALEQRRGGDAGRLFLSAASRLEPLDPELARETYLEALGGRHGQRRRRRRRRAGGRGRRARGATRHRSAADGRRAARRVRDPPDRRIRGRRADTRSGSRASARARRLRRGCRSGARRSPAPETATSLRSRCGTTRPCISSPLAKCRSPATRVHSCTCSSRSASCARSHMLAGELAAADADDRRSPLDRRGDGKPSARERPDDSRRLARRRGAGVRADRSHVGGGGRTAMDVQQLREMPCSTTASADMTPRAMRPGKRSSPIRSDTERIWCPSWPRRHPGPATERCSSPRWSGSRSAPRVISSGWASGIEARVRALLSEGEVADSLYRESIAHLVRYPCAARARPDSPSLRGVAATRTAPPRRPKASAHRA